MVSVVPPVRQARFIARQVVRHLEELAYLWQVRRKSVRSTELAIRDWVYLMERIEAHVQGVLVAGDAIGELVDGCLYSKDRDEVFAGACPLLRTGVYSNAIRVLKCFAEATGSVLAGLTDALAVASPASTEQTLRAALANGSPEHAAAAAVALSCHHRLSPTDKRLNELLAAEEPAVAAPAWRAVLHADDNPAMVQRPFGPALEHSDQGVRAAAFESAVWRGERWVWKAMYRLAREGDVLGLGWLTACSPGGEAPRVMELLGQLPPSSRIPLSARLGHPLAMEAMLASMADSDQAVAASAGQAWTLMTGLDVEGKRVDLPPAEGEDASHSRDDFPVTVWLPELAKARRQWQANGQTWREGCRWRRGFEVQSMLGSQAQRAIDLAARWDFGARAALTGVRVFAPPPAI